MRAGHGDPFEAFLGGLASGPGGEPDAARQPVDELEAGHVFVVVLAIRAESDAPEEAVVAPDRFAEDSDGPLAGPDLRGAQAHERRLAGAVRAEQSRDPRTDFQVDFVQRNDFAVPAGDVAKRDSGIHDPISTLRIRRSTISAHKIEKRIKPATT